MKRRAVIDRRRWLQLVGTGVAGTAFSCGDNLGPAEGAIIHEPTVDGFVVAVWSRYERELTVQIRLDDDLVGNTTFDVVPNLATALEVYDLEPDRAYDVTVIGGDTHTYRARTAPADDATRPVRIAVSADFDPSPEFDSDLCDHIVAAAPELFVAIGDFPYTDDGPPAVTLSSYRERHAALRNAPRLRAVLEAMPLRAIYDDHEFRNNWDASSVAAEPDRFAAAMQAWDEFFPLREPRDDVRYRNWRWGANLECFLLDARRFRSADSAPDGADKTMLGQIQRDWLIAGLAASTATFKLVFTSVPLAYGTGSDHWTSFAHERNALFDAIAKAGVSGVLFISGDQHWFALHRHAHGLREVQIGPMARGLGAPPEAVAGVMFRSVRFNAGIIDVDAESLTVAGLGADGSRFFQATFSPAELTPVTSSTL